MQTLPCWCDCEQRHPCYYLCGVRKFQLVISPSTLFTYYNTFGLQKCSRKSAEAQKTSGLMTPPPPPLPVHKLLVNLEQLEETEQNRLKVLRLELMMQVDVTSAFQMIWSWDDLSALKCQLEEVTTGQKGPPGRKIVHPQKQVGLSQVSPFQRRMLPGHADPRIQLQRPRNKQARRLRGTFQDVSAFARRWCET